MCLSCASTRSRTKPETAQELDVHVFRSPQSLGSICNITLDMIPYVQLFVSFLPLEDTLCIVLHAVGVNDQRLAKLKADVQRLDRLSVDPKVHPLQF